MSTFLILNTAVINMEEPSNVGTTITGIIHELAEITGLSESQLIGEEGWCSRTGSYCNN